MEEIVEDVISKIDDAKEIAIIHNEFEIIYYYCNASYHCIVNLYKQRLLTNEQYVMYKKRINTKMRKLYFELEIKYNFLFLEISEIKYLLQSNSNVFN